MTFKDIVAEVPQLSVEERYSLITILHHSLDEVRSAKTLIGEDTEHPSSILALRGFLKKEGAPPTDDELKDDYVVYLMEKYG
ncbi:MAG: hypothetical protein KDD73_16820 [Anaerolineales bacterium]|nr:hypothetical protein [Anaerolineales bacterium]MCB9127580.1 hypothetical protein [Ardenticatenales bacterium]